MLRSRTTVPLLLALLAGSAAAACSSNADDAHVNVSTGVQTQDDDFVSLDDATGVDSPNEASSASESARIGLRCKSGSCDEVARGRNFFFAPTNQGQLHKLVGNGRACSTCHVASDSFQLSPATAKARYDALQAARAADPSADDPLFRPIDADDFRTAGNAASDYSNLTQNGLIRVSIPLPANVKLINPATNQPSTETVADVWRSVPSVRNVALTGPDGKAPAWPRGPNTSGGYQLDARITTLQQQALGAFQGHAQTTVLPAQGVLDDLTSFQNTLFSSDGVMALADAVSSGATTLPDPDPELSPLEQQGKAVFQRACTQCHGGPGQSTPIQQNFFNRAIVRYHNVVTQCPRPVDTASPKRWNLPACTPSLAKNVRTYEITTAGVKSRITTSDPGRLLLTGNAADAGLFDIPSLRGLSQTAPYFTNNSAATITDVVIHYEEFFKRVKAVNPVAPILTTDGVHQDRPNTPAERDALVAYLSKQ
jgi:cytochrome c peroxidase